MQEKYLQLNNDKNQENNVIRLLKPCVKDSNPMIYVWKIEKLNTIVMRHTDSFLKAPVLKHTQTNTYWGIQIKITRDFPKSFDLRLKLLNKRNFIKKIFPRLKVKWCENNQILCNRVFNKFDRIDSEEIKFINVVTFNNQHINDIMTLEFEIGIEFIEYYGWFVFCFFFY